MAKRYDLGTPQAPAEGWPPSALPLLMITLQPDLILHTLNNRCNSLADTDAHGCQAVTSSTAFQFVQQSDHQPRSTGTKWMPQGDCSTVDIQLLLVNL